MDDLLRRDLRDSFPIGVGKDDADGQVRRGYPPSTSVFGSDFARWEDVYIRVNGAWILGVTCVPSNSLTQVVGYLLP